jgi:hypothetical protein
MITGGTFRYLPLPVFGERCSLRAQGRRARAFFIAIMAIIVLTYIWLKFRIKIMIRETANMNTI